ncbi:MFS general substrate transporter [Aspergillus ellipticus CBS 707.79]|uniref:MFS general substrate transporter n=1 Tax=Aspergillus ellipticus CBS 707.79 TaxID=1448320 RepID=A0A319DZZ3_9EURO|nr:MFS general substrate transporter [Aspergillus ellipticus CBS 707.79]
MAGQDKPPELPSLWAEICFVIVCSMGQLLFAIFLANTLVNQLTLVSALGISSSLSPWLVGSFLLANGISVVVSGSLADLVNPKWLIVGAFAWLTIWNLVGVFSITPSLMVLFFFVRSMQGLAVGVLESAAMSILGRVYKPGQRKNQVFSLMSAMIPMGFGIGALQGGAFSAHLQWVFASTAILSLFCTLAAFCTVPQLKPSVSDQTGEPLSIKHFDYLGAGVGMCGCGVLIFGLTQGAPTDWTPYTYALVIVGVLFFVAFYVIERRASRPLIEHRLWKTPGFVPLIVSYFLDYESFVGGWMFYAVRLFLTIQGRSPIITACYLLPITFAGVIASWIVARTLHLLPGHYILITSMVAFSLGPVFFLPQTVKTTYWALSFPGIILSTFGPDLSFAAASIFITSNVLRSFQGAAGSLIITAQNLSSAIFTAVGDTIGEKVTHAEGYSLDLHALRAIWWFSFGTALLGALICAALVRISKSEEKEHVH